MQIEHSVRLLDRSTPPHILTLTTLAGIGALSMSIFLPSLGAMSDHFGVDYGVMQLAVSGYLFATAAIQLIAGPLSDRFGRRPVTMVALLLFIVATLGTLIAPNITVFMICRLLQAAVATCLAMSRAVVRDLYPPHQAASRLGYVTMGMSIIPMIGPMVGGALQEVAGWQSVFVFLLIAGLAATVLTWRDMGETISGKGLTLREQISGYPELMRSVRFWGYVACTAFSSGAYYALLGGASFVAGTVFELSPMWAGIGLGAPASGYLVGNFLSGRYSVRLGINRMALIGSMVSTVGLGTSLIVTLLGVSDPLIFFGFCMFLGLGNGMTMPNATAGSLSVRPQLAGTASGLGGAIMIVGGSVMAVIAGAALDPAWREIPLQIIMLSSSALSVLALLVVIRRDRRLSDDLPR